MISGKGSTTAILTTEDVQQLVARACEPLALDGKRVLVIIPDGTRTAPIPLFFRTLYEQLGRRVAQLDYLIALGTHPPMSDEAVDQLVGVPANARVEQYPNVRIFNHQWSEPEMLRTIGIISREEAENLTGGLLSGEVPVTLNRMIFAYDQLIICGPVFPHEVAGFSGGAKYLFPGIAGPDIINFTHWLGALVTSMHTIGVKDTPTRRVIHRAADFLPIPLLCIAMAACDGKEFARPPNGSISGALQRGMTEQQVTGVSSNRMPDRIIVSTCGTETPKPFPLATQTNAFGVPVPAQAESHHEQEDYLWGV